MIPPPDRRSRVMRSRSTAMGPLAARPSPSATWWKCRPLNGCARCREHRRGEAALVATEGVCRHGRRCLGRLEQVASDSIPRILKDSSIEQGFLDQFTDEHARGDRLAGSARSGPSGCTRRQEVLTARNSTWGAVRTLAISGLGVQSALNTRGTSAAALGDLTAQTLTQATVRIQCRKCPGCGAWPRDRHLAPIVLVAVQVAPQVADIEPGGARDQDRRANTQTSFAKPLLRAARKGALHPSGP